MQLNSLPQHTWRHGRQGAYPTSIKKVSPLTLQEPAVSPLYRTLSRGDRRPDLLDDSLSNSIQRLSLAVPKGFADSASSVQKQQPNGAVLHNLEMEEISPADVMYRLQPLEDAPSQRKNLGGASRYSKPGWFPVIKPHREWFKPWKTENVTQPVDEPSHSGHIQGRRTAPRGLPSHLSDAQSPVWSHVLSPDLVKSSRGIVQSTQHGWSMLHAHEELSRTKPEIAIVGTKSIAKADEATPSRMSYLPPIKLLAKRMKSKGPPNTPVVFQARFQKEPSSRRLFRDWRTQPQVHYESHEKPLVPLENEVNTRIAYMPLFTERMKLCNPKTNSIKPEMNIFSTKKEKSIRPGPEFWPQKQNLWRKTLPE